MSLLQELLWLNEKGRLVTGSDPKPKPDLIACCRSAQQEFSSVIAEFSSLAPSDQFLHKLTAVYNRAALLQYHFGDYSRAEDLCHKAIALCAEEEQPGSKLWVLAILQPYVNLARVASAKGDWVRAREILDYVFQFTENGQSLWLDNYLLQEFKKPASHGDREETKNFGRAVFVSDSLRALLVADRHHELLQFAETNLQSDLASNPEFWMVLSEAKSRALIAMGQSREALAVLRGMLARMKSTGRLCPALYCIVAEVYSRQGNTSFAQDVILRIDRAYAQALEHSGKPSAALHFLCMLALSELSHGLHENARANAAKAISVAERLQDEGGKLKAMTLLAYSSSLQKATACADTRWHAMFCDLLLNTYYRLERVVGCCIAAHCSCILDDYIEFESGRRHLFEHALDLCAQVQSELFNEAARLIGTHVSEEFMRNTGGIISGDQFSHPGIDDLYERLMTFQPSRHIKQNARPALKLA